MRRAFRRMQIHGHTWYRGRLWQQDSLSEVPTSRPLKEPQTPPFDAPPQPSEHIPRHRLIIWNWNAGQLSPGKYQELLRYLHQERVDVAVLSETHWQYTSEWTTPYFHAIHSGSNSGHSYEKAAGLLVLVSKRICQAHQIAWHDVIPGRLIHCRLHLEYKPFDILGIYQYPWDTRTAQKTRRQSLWRHLRGTLQALPHRNHLGILGDFNCSLPSIARLVGTSTFSGSAGRMMGPQHGDMADFACILQDFQLIALNTWTSTHGATYQSPMGSSRIDFQLTKLRDADNLAKQVGLIFNAPFLADGPHHVPLMSSLSFKYHRPSRTRSGVPRQVKQKCMDAFRQETLFVATM